MVTSEDVYLDFVLGLCCFDGRGTEVDSDKALEYYKKAADGNNENVWVQLKNILKQMKLRLRHIKIRYYLFVKIV